MFFLKIRISITLNQIVIWIIFIPLDQGYNQGGIGGIGGGGIGYQPGFGFGR